MMPPVPDARWYSPVQGVPNQGFYLTKGSSPRPQRLTCINVGFRENHGKWRMFRRLLIAFLAVAGTAGAASVVIAMGSMTGKNPPSPPADSARQTPRTTEDAFADCVGPPGRIPESRDKAAIIVR